ncbi:MAG: hypothetical protein P8R38_00030 [Planctomycetota bacterium]|nr:hypothetical protein [Planctomycetota bacterium]MDG2085656.1 hypothetical protein [Planctomycetota bacterium]
MKYSAVLLLLFCSACFGISSRTVSDSENFAELNSVRDAMHAYYEAFNVDDYQVITESWHTPGWVSVGEASHVLLNPKEVKDFYQGMLGKIRSEGYSHSQLIDEEFELINEGCALCRITFTRFLENGEVMEPKVRGAHYTILKRDGKWGINALILDADPHSR